jgi:hypothetical protein
MARKKRRIAKKRHNRISKTEEKYVKALLRSSRRGASPDALRKLLKHSQAIESNMKKG